MKLDNIVFVVPVVFMLHFFFLKQSNSYVLSTFYETLEEKSKNSLADSLNRPRYLRSFKYDVQNELYYVAAVDRVYTLSANLTELNSYKRMDLSSPCNGNGNNKPCINNYIQLLLFKESDNDLIFCGSANEGSCEKLEGGRIEKNVVSTSNTSISVGLVHDNKLLIGTSTYESDANKPFAMIELNKGNNKKSSAYFKLLNKQSTNVTFKSAFLHDGAAYFLSQRNQSSYITRLCASNYVSTFVETKISCSHNNVRYPILQQAKLPQQENVNDNDNLQKSLYAVFYSPATRSSVLCLYSLNDIRNRIVEAVRTSSTHNDKVFVKESAKFEPDVSESIDNSTNYCKRLASPPITNSRDELLPTTVKLLGSYEVTSLALKYDEDDVNMMIVSYGTSCGKVFKISINSFSDSLDPVQLNLNDQTDTILDLNSIIKNNLVVLTQRRMFNVKSLRCDEIHGMKECVEDPLCGYCSFDNACTSSMFACKNLTNIYVKDLVHFSIAPTMVDNHDILRSTFSVTTTTSVKQLSLKCILLHLASNTVSEVLAEVSGDQKRITCRDFPQLHQPTDNFYGGGSKTSQNFAPSSVSAGGTLKQKYVLLLKNDDMKIFLWTGGEIDGINCANAANCTECMESSGRLCHWCQMSQKCQPVNDRTCAGGTLAADVAMCPKIIPPKEANSLYFHSDAIHNVSLQINNLQINNDLICEVVGSNIAPSTSPSVVRNNQVTCVNLRLTYSSNMAEESQLIRFYRVVNNGRRYIDGSSNITVYKCNKLSSSCGKCKHYMTQLYDCQWCTGSCQHDKLCPLSPACSDLPVIHSISPVGTVLGGKPRLTILGTNFNMPVSELNIKVNENKCQSVVISADRERIDCTLHTQKRAESGVLELIYMGTKKVSSTQIFHVKNIVVDRIVPSAVVRSGGSLVTFVGSNLHYGSSVKLFDDDNKVSMADEVVSQNSTRMVMRMKLVRPTRNMKFIVDSQPININSDSLSVIDDPLVRRVEKCQSFFEGGTKTVFRLTDPLFADTAHLIVHLENGGNRTSVCNISNKSLECPTPSLVDTGHKSEASFDFGILVGNVTNLINLCKYSESSFPLKQIKYYKVPTIDPLPHPYLLYPADKKHHFYDIVSSNNTLLKLFASEMLLEIGSLDVKTDESLRFELPKYEMLINDEAADSKLLDMTLRIGKYKTVCGKIQLKPKMDLTLLIGVLVGVLLAFLTIVFVAYFIFKCYKLHHKHQNHHPITTTNELTSLREASNKHDASKNPYSTNLGVPPSDVMDDESYLDNLLKSMDGAFDNELFIERDSLQIGDLVGQGNFGSVYVATLLSKDEKTETTVAVKTIDDPEMNIRAAESFIREGLMMKKFDHPHVLSLYGVCLGYKKEPMVILPYMPNGDLKSYVKEPNRQFTARELLQLVHQVSQGMAYLASINFIHRDLAARNCMIDEMKQVKVADFGLSHELHEKNYYSTKDKKAKLPIKWMALESLESFVFTLKSDVWSFGVLMWEVMTRGVTPYPDVEVFEIRDYLASGRRLRRPKFCPENVYNIMLACWNESAVQRPSFVDLVHDIEVTLNPPRKSDSPEPNYNNLSDLQSSNHYLASINA